MDSQAFLVALIGTIALVIQASSCLLKQHRPTTLGVLNFWLAATVFFAATAMAAGRMVLATDLGIIMAQGAWTVFLLRAALVAAGVVPAICWFLISRANGWNRSLTGVIIAGVIVGVVTATQVEILSSPADPLPIAVHDLWWAPLVGWLTICLAGSMLALVEAASFLDALGLAAAILAPVSVLVLRWPGLIDHHADRMWITLKWVTLLVAIVALAVQATREELAINANAPPQTRNRRGYGAGIVFLVVLLPAFFFDGLAGFIWRCLPLALRTLRMSISVMQQASDFVRTSRDQAGAAQASSTLPGWVDARIVRVDRAQAAALSLSLPIIAAGLIDLTTLGVLPQWFDFAVVLIFWIVLAEKLAEGTLDQWPQWLRHGADLPFVRPACAALLRAGASLRRAGASMSTLFSGSPWVVGVKSLLAVMAAIALIAAVSEVLTSRSTVIKRFRWAGPDEPKNDKAQGEAMSDLLINALGRLRYDLRTDLLTVRKPSGEYAAVAGGLVGDDADGLANAVAKSGDVTISSVSVPVGFFVGPIQGLVRSAMGVRVIEGTVWKPDARFAVVVNSTTGESWRGPVNDLPAVSEAACALPAGSDTGDDRASLVERLAFDIASADPAFVGAGLTRNYGAFLRYRTGLVHWTAFEAGGNRRQLKAAIECFRDATTRDRQFAPAQYRLGLALRRAGEPRSAIEAFRASSGASAFVPAVLEEAATLYNFGSYFVGQPAVAPPAEMFDSQHSKAFGPGDSSSQPDWKSAAVNLWQGIVALPEGRVSTSEQRTAYLGLCQAELDRADSDDGRRPYFYCSRAEALWHRMSVGRTDPRERTNEAWTQYFLGLALTRHRGEDKWLTATRLENEWSCVGDAASFEDVDQAGLPNHFRLSGSPLSNRAVDYFSRGLEYDPKDPMIRCALATALVYAREDPAEMGRLSRNAASRYAAAAALAESAKRQAHSEGGKPPDTEVQASASWYYGRALNEYHAAIGLDPAFVDALNGYAYTAWEWTVDSLAHRTSTRPDRSVLARAERYAREGTRIASFWKVEDSRRAVEGTLGEILIAQGRHVEGVDTVEHLLDTAGEWEGGDEARWDLALAKVCGALQARPADARPLRDQAYKHYLDILTSERGLDRRLFTESHDALEPGVVEAACPEPPDAPLARPARYRLRRPVYEEGSTCARIDVVPRVAGDKSGGVPLMLHVWGGGVDRRIPAAAGSKLSVALPATAFKPRYYFAALEDAGEGAMSATVSLEASSQLTGNACRTRLVLEFEASEAPPARPESVVPVLRPR